MHVNQTDEATQDLRHELSLAIETQDLAHLYLIWTHCRDGTRQPSDYGPEITLELLHDFAMKFRAQLSVD